MSSPRKDEQLWKASSPITSSDDAAGKWMDSSFEHARKACSSMRFKESGKVSSPRKDEHPEKASFPITSSDDGRVTV